MPSPRLRYHFEHHGRLRASRLTELAAHEGMWRLEKQARIFSVSRGEGTPADGQARDAKSAREGHGEDLQNTPVDPWEARRESPRVDPAQLPERKQSGLQPSGDEPAPNRPQSHRPEPAQSPPTNSKPAKGTPAEEREGTRAKFGAPDPRIGPAQAREIEPPPPTLGDRASAGTAPVAPSASTGARLGASPGRRPSSQPKPTNTRSAELGVPQTKLRSKKLSETNTDAPGLKRTDATDTMQRRLSRPPADEGPAAPPVKGASSGSELAEPYDELVATLKSHREELWREYEIAQDKIDSSTRFRIIVLGWSLTAASLVSIAVGLAKLAAATACAALAFTAALLVVVHKLATDQLATGLALGERARVLERQLQRSRALEAELAEVGRAAVNAVGATTNRGQRIRGRKLAPEKMLVRRVRRQCREPLPRIATVATSERLTLCQFLLICLIGLFPPAARWTKLSTSPPSPGWANKSPPPASLLSSQHILGVQLGFVFLGVMLALFSPHETPTAADKDNAGEPSTNSEESKDAQRAKKPGSRGTSTPASSGDPANVGSEPASGDKSPRSVEPNASSGVLRAVSTDETVGTSGRPTQTGSSLGEAGDTEDDEPSARPQNSGQVEAGRPRDGGTDAR